MPSFSQKIDLKYDTDTYEGVRDNYNWIIKSAQKLTNEELDIDSEFLFQLGKVDCSASGIDEFVNQCYGTNEFKLTAFDVFIRKKHGGRLFSALYCLKLDVFADSRNDLEKIITILNQTSLEETSQENTPYTVNEYHNVGVVVSGDNNVVANNNSTIANNGSSVNHTPAKESAIKQWIVSISQNLAANLIWYLLTAVGASLITYIVLKNPI